MGIQSVDEPIWYQFRNRFREEYVCLKCHKIREDKSEICPNCGGAMCVRIIPK
jgi:rRNA maturation endonuclease Nob1